MTEKIITLDLSKETTFPVIIYGRVGDEKMQTVRVKVTRYHQNISLNGYKITFEGAMSGKVKVFDSENVKTDSGQLTSGEFTYTFPSKVFSQSGKYEQAYFAIEKSGQRDTTGNFKIVVLDNADIDAQEAETIISQYNKLVKELQDLQKKNIAALDNQVAATRKSLSEVSQKVDQAVAKFEKADFYTKNAAEEKFAEKKDVYRKQESDNKYVDFASKQDITGVKNFTNGVQISGKSLNYSIMEMLLNVGKKAWDGAAYLHETQSVKPSIPLDKCLTGWLALYQPYDSATGKAQPWDLNYKFIPKTHALDYSGLAVVHHLETLNGSRYNKYIYVSNTEIRGHKNNGTAAKDYVITKIYSV